jgi:hypothetical protein
MEICCRKGQTFGRRKGKGNDGEEGDLENASQQLSGYISRRQISYKIECLSFRTDGTRLSLGAFDDGELNSKIRGSQEKRFT